MNVSMIKDADIIRNYDSSGVFFTELLPGVYDGPMKAYKYYLKAGSSVSPSQYSDKAVVLIFGKGKGYITAKDGAFHINELCFYAPNYDLSHYTITASADMEFIMCVCDMDDYDFEREKECSVYLPYFRTITQCYRYDQYCKSEGLESRSVLFGDCGRLGKITVGYCRGVDCGTIEKGHREVHQFNYAVGEDCDFTLTTEADSKHIFRHVEGDWSFVTAGPDHSLVASPGKAVCYVWVEIYTSAHGIY